MVLIPGAGSWAAFCLIKPDFTVVWCCSARPPFDLALVLCWGSDFALQVTGGWRSLALDCSLASAGAWISDWILPRALLAFISSTLWDDLWSRALRFCWQTSCRPLLGTHWISRSVTECRERNNRRLTSHKCAEWTHYPIWELTFEMNLNSLSSVADHIHI